MARGAADMAAGSTGQVTPVPSLPRANDLSINQSTTRTVDPAGAPQPCEAGTELRTATADEAPPSIGHGGAGSPGRTESGSGEPVKDTEGAGAGDGDFVPGDDASSDDESTMQVCGEGACIGVCVVRV